MGTPDQAKAQLAALSKAGIDRGLLSVNCDLHLDMLPLLIHSQASASPGHIFGSGAPAPPA